MREKAAIYMPIKASISRHCTKTSDMAGVKRLWGDYIPIPGEIGNLAGPRLFSSIHVQVTAVRGQQFKSSEYYLDINFIEKDLFLVRKIKSYARMIPTISLSDYLH